MNVVTTASCIFDRSAASVFIFLSYFSCVLYNPLYSLLALPALPSFLHTSGGFRAHIKDTDSWAIHNNVTHRLNHNKSESAQIHRKFPSCTMFSTPANALPISMQSLLPPISLPTQPRNLMSMRIPARRRKNCNHHSGSAQTMLTTTLYSC